MNNIALELAEVSPTEGAKSSGEGVPVYVFGSRDEYRIRVASSIEDRRKAWEFVYQIYSEKGYARTDGASLWYGVHDALPNTTTLIAERDGSLVATLTVVFDNPLRLPADAVYGRELDAMRAKGRRPCEIISLVHTEKRAALCFQVVKHLFKLAFVTASHIEKSTDFIITVNPHHVGYYKRGLLFDMLAGERTYDKVSGAPAVLLGLDLVNVEKAYRERFAHLSADCNLYKFFCRIPQVAELAAWLQAQRQPLDTGSLRRYFIDNPLFAVDPMKQSQLDHIIGAYNLPVTGLV